MSVSGSAVDFYLYSPHETATWEPIVRALRRREVDARYVLEPPGKNLAHGSASDHRRRWLDDKSGPLVPLVDAEAFERIAAAIPSDLTPLDRRRTTAAVVTTQAVDWLRRWTGPRIRTMYGVGLVEDAYGHGPVNGGFDLILAHGPFSKRSIRSSVPDAPVVVAGFPKWAAFRRGDHDRAAAAAALKVSGSRPVLAWVPTWAHTSSLDAFGHAIEQLAGDYQVLVKPHANSVRFERDRLAAIPGGLRVVPTTTNLVDLLSVADTVVADVRSGALTEAMLADRNVVGVDLSVDGPLHPDLTSVAGVCRKPSDLGGAIERAADPTVVAARRALVPDLFGAGGGNDDEVAAAAIAELLEHGRGVVRRRLEGAVYSIRGLVRR